MVSIGQREQHGSEWRRCGERLKFVKITRSSYLLPSRQALKQCILTNDMGCLSLHSIQLPQDVLWHLSTPQARRKQNASATV